MLRLSSPPPRKGKMPSELAKKDCIPCKGGVPPLDSGAIDKFLRQLDGGWKAVNGHHLEKEYAFKNFVDALDFTNRIGAIAEEQGHHPDIYLAWGKVRLTIWTHKIDGLTESDFVLAAKADEAFEQAPSRKVAGG
jgi:4a-hydroxytetrahydrobiopterin dehydratase